MRFKFGLMPTLLTLALAIVVPTPAPASAPAHILEGVGSTEPTLVIEARAGRRAGVRHTTVRRSTGAHSTVRRTTTRAHTTARRTTTRHVTRVTRGRWVRPSRYWWRPGGAIAAGAAIGFVTAATAAAWAGAPPGPDMCWYYSDSSRTKGFWDVCPK